MKKIFIFLLYSFSLFAMPEIKDELLEAKPEKEIKRHKYYSNKTELGLTHANGNSNYQTYNFKTRNFYRYNKQFLIFGGHYTYGEANSLLNSQNWDFNLSYYYKLTSNFASVIGGTVEGNRFQELKRRENTDIAGKYYFIKGKIQKLNLQVGYRYTIENFYGDTDHLVQHKGRVLLSWKNKLSKNLATEAVVDYIPNFSTKEDWIAGFELGISNNINDVFSLKVSYKYAHDNLPASPELKKYDGLFLTSLVATFD